MTKKPTLVNRIEVQRITTRAIKTQAAEAARKRQEDADLADASLQRLRDVEFPKALLSVNERIREAAARGERSATFSTREAYIAMLLVAELQASPFRWIRSQRAMPAGCDDDGCVMWSAYILYRVEITW